MIDFVRVGLKISEYRKKLNMTQDELSSKLYVTRQALSKWENGTGIPSANVLLSLCKVFNISFEEILCLEDELEIDENDIFKGHDRKFIINKICNNELNVNLADVFYLFSPSERMIVLKSIKENKILIDNDKLSELFIKLTISE